MPSGTNSWRYSLIPWAVLVIGAVLLLLGAPPASKMLPGLQNDSAMRLVQVRDLLAGQNWFDMTQYRLGLDGGFEMHWSRLVDAPIAALILVLRPIFGTDGAEYAALIIWPVLMFCVALWATIRIVGALGDRHAIVFAVLISTINFIYYSKFRPGELDHHNLQLVLLLLAVVGVLRRHEGVGYAILSGSCIALSVSIGAELVPLMAVVAVAVAGFWAAFGGDERKTAMAFSGALIVTGSASFFGTAPVSAYAGGFCDALSIDIAIPVGLASLSLFIGAWKFSQISRAMRLALLGGLFAFVLTVTIIVFPACLSNPLDGLDPYLQEHWLSRVSEARGFSTLWSSRPSAFLAIVIPAVFAVVAGALLSIAGQNRAEWLFVMALVTFALAAAIYQFRGSISLTALVTIPVAVGVAKLTDEAQLGARTAFKIAGIVLLFTALAPLWKLGEDFLPGKQNAQRTVALNAKAKPTLSDCFAESEQNALRTLPSGRISASSNLGAQILLQSNHTVMSAPYHRNEAGMIAQLRIALSETDEGALAYLQEHKVDYVAICAGDAEYVTRGGNEIGDLRFLFRVAGGHRPDFLQEIPVAEGSPLKLFRVN